MAEHDEPDGYDGEVTVRVAGQAHRHAHGHAEDRAEEQTARAALVARFDPLAGSVVWSGRVSAGFPLRTVLEITTPHGTGRAEARERDVWGNTRVTGLGRPPFPVELLEVAAEPREG